MDAKTIIQFRLTHNLSQEDLAQLIGCSAGSVSRAETNTMTLPYDSRQALKQLIDGHGVHRDIHVIPGSRQYRAPRGMQKITLDHNVTTYKMSERENIAVPPQEKPYQVVDAVVAGVGPDAPVVVNESGGKQSASPYRMDLIDPKAILEISKVLSEGAEKYGEDNWKQISVKDHLNHLLVHIYAYLAGDKSDEHLSHSACRAIFALATSKEETA